MDTVYNIIMGLLAIVVSAFTSIEHLARDALTQAGVSGQVQTILLLVLGVVLILAAVRLLGGVFGILIAIFLILFLFHIIAPTSFMTNFPPHHS
jgi:Flp pilus assembly protein TadB